MEPKVSQSVPSRLPKAVQCVLKMPQCSPRCPKVCLKAPQATQWHSTGSQRAMQASKNALAFQSEFKESPCTKKLPINRTSGHYVPIFLLFCAEISEEFLH